MAFVTPVGEVPGGRELSTDAVCYDPHQAGRREEIVAGECGARVRHDGCMACADRATGWFCHLAPEALADYDSLGMHLLIPSGGRLFCEGQPARNVSILCSGKVKLTVSSREGKTLLVRIAKPGDVLGLSAAMSASPHETTAQALEPAQVKSLQRQDFLQFIERHIEGSMHAAQMLNREYRDALSDATRLALCSSISGRVARLLLQMACEQDDTKPRFTLPLTHEELSSMLGTSRETVTRVLSEFKRAQIISIKGRSVTICRADALELLA